MKKLSILLLLFCVLTYSCKDDDPIEKDFILQHDGDNATGPQLDAGTYEAAVRFVGDDVSIYSGNKLTEVEFFMGNEPASCRVIVYDEGANNTPGNELYTANINSVQSPAWNTHRLATPVDITGDNLWISIELVHDQSQQSIGCDAGPRSTNGDWLFQDSDGNWETYQNRTGESVNWNIRGKVEE